MEGEALEGHPVVCSLPQSQQIQRLQHHITLGISGNGVGPAVRAALEKHAPQALRRLVDVPWKVQHSWLVQGHLMRGTESAEVMSSPHRPRCAPLSLPSR